MVIFSYLKRTEVVFFSEKLFHQWFSWDNELIYKKQMIGVSVKPDSIRQMHPVAAKLCFPDKTKMVISK